MKSTPENSAKVIFEKIVSKIPHVKLFTNLRGNFWAGVMAKHTGTSVVLKFAHRLKAGCGPDGFPDYLGWKQIKITEAMVGKTIAQFCAREIKRFDGKGRATPEQIDMIDFINAQGGDARIINSEEQIISSFGVDNDPIT